MSRLLDTTGEFEDLISISGSPPDLIDLPSGCTFHPRCPYATERCQGEEPVLTLYEEDHAVACFHSDRVRREADVMWKRHGDQPAGEV